ncbi:MAG: efflux RND transporter periplasmic adaptor subunit, partial [Xanthomonadaceae bacterium]|nr:efflux RND transporter periplasmic adaptor subunit [Xanthomonadaceae bacterium]
AGGAQGGGPPAGAAAGGGAGGGDWRARVQQMMKASLAPFRDSLDDAQRGAWDREVEQVLNARRVVLWVLEGGKPVAKVARAGVSDATHTEVMGVALEPGTPVIVGAG